MGRIRWRLPIKPKLVAQTLLKGRKVHCGSTGFKVFLPMSIRDNFSIGNITFTVKHGIATPDRPIPESWLRRL